MGRILLQPASAKSAPEVPVVLEEEFQAPIILSSRHRPSGIRQTNACQLQMRGSLGKEAQVGCWGSPPLQGRRYGRRGKIN